MSSGWEGGREGGEEEEEGKKGEKGKEERVGGRGDGDGGERWD